METNTFAPVDMMMTDTNRKIVKPIDGFTAVMPHNKHRRPHTGLLRRRHSLPEIIMRK